MDTSCEDASNLDGNLQVTQSGPEDNLKKITQVLESSQTRHQKRGRPRRQIQVPVIETSHPKIEPKCKPKTRSQISSSLVQSTNDPWLNLSKAPFITPLSPNKHSMASPLAQKPVNEHLCWPCKYL